MKDDFSVATDADRPRTFPILHMRFIGPRVGPGASSRDIAAIGRPGLINSNVLDMDPVG